jgi:hypothetical protein
VIEEELQGRRRKLVSITTWLLHNMLSPGPAVQLQCTEGLPRNARFIGLTYDFQCDIYALCFESDEWEPVPLFEPLPNLSIQYMRWELRPLFDQAAAWLAELPPTDERNAWLQQWREMRERMEVSE